MFTMISATLAGIAELLVLGSDKRDAKVSKFEIQAKGELK